MTLPRDILQSVAPDDIAALLRARAWTEAAPTEHRASAVFRLWTLGEHRVQVPLARGFDDYAERIADIFRVLRELYRVDDRKLTHELVEVTHDTLRLRDDRKSAPTRLETTTSLDEGRRLLDAAHETWGAGARRVAFSETNGERRRERVQQFMDALTLGHTEEGSFVIRVMTAVPSAPPPPQSAIAGMEPDPPFQRRAAEQVAHSARVLADAVAEASSHPADVRIIFARAGKEGVTASMCEAVARATGDPGTQGVELSMSWAATLQRMRPALPPVRFESPDVPLLEEGAAALRRREAPAVSGIEGWVVRLHREPDAAGGEVVVIASVGGQPRSVIVRLEGDDYQRAVDAHAKGSAVACSGILKKTGKRFELDGAHRFRLLAGSDGLPF